MSSSSDGREHGGGIDAARAKYGGARSDWLDLSTGISPWAYPLPTIRPDAWTQLPDKTALHALVQAARVFWQVPTDISILPVPGASIAIAQMPRLYPKGTVSIPGPTYNEHAASFEAHGWAVTDNTTAEANAQVLVHPNNPDGRMWDTADCTAPWMVIDESFCDITPNASFVPHLAADDSHIVLKSFGKFWGLAGLRLGFVIGAPDQLDRLRNWIGPWAVSGPALAIGSAALQDITWANAQRARLANAANRMDALIAPKHAKLIGGTDLFRLYEMPDAAHLYDQLARHLILTRTFGYNRKWLRIGLPAEDGWDRLAAAL